MKRCLWISYLLLILADLAPCCARSDSASAISKEEPADDDGSRSIAHHEPLRGDAYKKNTGYRYESLFDRDGDGATTRDFLLRPALQSPLPTLAPVVGESTKPVSPNYFYKPLFSFTRRPPPTPQLLIRPTTVPIPRTSPPTQRPPPEPLNRPTPPSSRPTPAPSPKQTSKPTIKPTKQAPPTNVPLTTKPTPKPFMQLTPQPSPRPTKQAPPTNVPLTTKPTPKPSMQPTPHPSPRPTPQVKPPKERPTPFTFSKPLSFEAGNFSLGTRSSDGNIFLSNGLSARPIAQAGKKVELADGTKSELRFHTLPDGAAVFPAKNGKKGWLYTSNSESDKRGTNWDDGGVGVLEFNEFGQVISYYRIANETESNCGGGATPWNSWVTCEEAKGGQIHQTDPYGEKQRKVTALGELGYYESVAYWEDGAGNVVFYATRDQSDGVVTRFTPDEDAMECYRQPNDYDRWCTLDSGTIEYLYLIEEARTVEWIDDERKAGKNAKKLYPGSEGIDVHNDVLYFTSKEDQLLVIVDLRADTYTSSSTRSGAFNNQPDQVDKVLGANARILLMCEDGGVDAGLHGRTPEGDYFTILYRDKKIRSSITSEETTGLGVSPDFKHIYVSFQHVGTIYDITRDDGRSFNSRLLDIKYHSMDS